VFIAGSELYLFIIVLIFKGLGYGSSISADQGSVRQDLRSILRPQRYMLATSAIPSSVLPNDLPSAITKSSGKTSGSGQGKELERLEELALVSLLDSLQTLLFRVLFDTSDKTTLEFRDSTPTEVTMVLSFLGSVFGHLSASGARLYSRLVLARRDSFIGSMRPDLAVALRSALLSTSGLIRRAAEAAQARIDQDNSSLAMVYPVCLKLCVHVHCKAR
jgi:hypothetical protein